MRAHRIVSFIGGVAIAAASVGVALGVSGLRTAGDDTGRSVGVHRGARVGRSLPFFDLISTREQGDAFVTWVWWQDRAREAEHRSPAVARRGGVNWDAIAQCETGGNWRMQGPRFSGGLGFANSTWNGYGGLEYAPNAGMATREQQIAVAWNVYAEHGLSGWGCREHG